MSTPTPAVKSGGLLIPLPPPAHTFAGRLRQALHQFDAQLKETENLKIVALFGNRPYAVEHINVRGAELVVVDGPADDASRYRILCHVDALQLMLLVEPKAPNEKRRRIGFVWDETDAAPAQEAPGAAPQAEPEPEPATMGS